MKKKLSSLLVVLVMIAAGIWQVLAPDEQLTPAESKQQISEVKEAQQSIEEIDLTDPPRFERLTVSSLRSVDGDTFAFYVDNKEYKLRLLMVDTPESVKRDLPVQPFGKEASAFTKEQLEKQTVSLMFDEEIVDHYGRLLAYVYVGDDSLQELLLENGLGIVRYVNPGGDTYKEELLQAQQSAQDQKLGVWSQDGYVFQTKNGYYRYNEVSEN